MAEQGAARGHGPGAALSCADSQSLCLIVRYDGTDYHGFQKQAGAQTIQGELERVLTALMGPGAVIGASRTDAGVHAAGQVAVWTGAVPVPMERAALILNRRLPAAIQVVRAFWVPKGWDPRWARAAKQYSYRVWRGTGPPDLAHYRTAYWHPGTLAWGRVQEGARLFIGEHDFRAFRTEGSSAETTIRRILASGWSMEADGRIWRYQVVGTGFLYRMVRHMVGSMLDAAGPMGSTDRILAGLQDPGTKVGALAPAAGLTLDWIQFRD